MHKKILFLLTGLIALSISAIPVLASDPPTDDGQYIWQDENGDYWYRNGSEDEYIGEGNYAPDPDSGELMEGNDAGWTEQDGYFEPHYYYEDGSVWLEDATGTTYIGSRDKYYIDDYGNLQEYSDSETDSSSGDSSEGSSDTSGNSSSQDSGSSYPNSSSAIYGTLLEITFFFGHGFSDRIIGRESNPHMKLATLFRFRGFFCVCIGRGIWV